MSVTLRPFRESDYPRLVEIGNLCHPEHRKHEEQLRHRDHSWDDGRYERLRLVAEEETGRVLGWGQVNHMPWQFHPRKYALEIQVDPAFRRRGIGSALYGRFLDELRQRNAVLVRATAQESMLDSIAFLAHRGFTEVQRTWESRLDVTRFDFARFAGAAERVAAQGIAMTTLAVERERDPDVLAKVFDLHLAADQDVPAIDPVTPVPFDVYLATNVNTPTALLDAYFLARDADRYVGVSNLQRSLEDPAILYQAVTAVRREYRGRGIALALKLQTVHYARANGYREIRTWNDVRNQPMLRINEALGFQKQPAWISFQKELA